MPAPSALPELSWPWYAEIWHRDNPTIFARNPSGDQGSDRIIIGTSELGAAPDRLALARYVVGLHNAALAKGAAQ